MLAIVRKICLLGIVIAYASWPFDGFTQNPQWELLDELDTSAPQPKRQDVGKETALEEGLLSDQSQVRSGLVLRTGLRPEEILSRFGQPNSKKERPATKTAAWYYGNSVIFFHDGKVSAWSDAGELSMRERLGGKGGKRSESFVEDGWVNAWQYRPQVNRKDIIDELLTEE